MSLEPVTDVAKAALDGLKARPDLLVLVLIVLIIAGLSFVQRRAMEQRHADIVEELMARCMEPAKR